MDKIFLSLKKRSLINFKKIWLVGDEMKAVKSFTPRSWAKNKILIKKRYAL